MQSTNSEPQQTLSEQLGLDTFTLEYIVTGLTLCDQELGEGAHPTEIASETLAQIKSDCHKFQDENGVLIAGLEKQAATDFWLTRNGHGSGFWDREDIWGKQASIALTDACKAYGEMDFYRGDDGLIYV